MNRKSRILIIISIIAIILGGGLFVIGFAMNDWNFKGLDKSNYVTNTYELEEDFVNFDIDVDTADIELIKSNEDSVEIVDVEEAIYTVKVEDNTLKIKLENQLNSNYLFNFTSPKISVYLTNSSYELLKINGDTGDVKVSNDFTFSDVNITLNTGDTYLSCNVYIAKSKIIRNFNIACVPINF